MQEKSAEIVSQIWNEARNRLKGFIARKIDNEADVEDVLQNVFFKIHQNLSKLNDPEKLYPWVFQTTRNAIADFYRDRKPPFDSTDETLGEIRFEIEEKDIEEEVLRWLEPMIEELPEKYREAVLLADIRGLKQKELSEKLDVTLSGAKSRVQRGREKLREILLDCCHLEFNRSGRIVEYRRRKKECRVCSH
jgi:RNA polymerase sigma-70 factor (ECF subfamily)